MFTVLSLGAISSAVEQLVPRHTRTSKTMELPAMESIEFFIKMLTFLPAHRGLAFLASRAFQVALVLSFVAKSSLVQETRFPLVYDCSLSGLA